MIASSRTGLIERLRQVVGDDGVLTARSDLLVYECDGFVIEKNSPDVVVFPTTAEQVSSLVKICGEETFRSFRVAPGRVWPVGACRLAVA